jgi:hypothetical protein
VTASRSGAAPTGQARECAEPTQPDVPSPNISTASRTRRSPRPARAANRSSTGAADPAIIPIIITAHMANVKNRSAAVQGVSIAIPISAIIVSCFMEDDI